MKTRRNILNQKFYFNLFLCLILLAGACKTTSKKTDEGAARQYQPAKRSKEMVTAEVKSMATEDDYAEGVVRDEDIEPGEPDFNTEEYDKIVENNFVSPRVNRYGN